MAQKIQGAGGSAGLGLDAIYDCASNLLFPRKALIKRVKAYVGDVSNIHQWRETSNYALLRSSLMAGHIACKLEIDRNDAFIIVDVLTSRERTKVQAKAYANAKDWFSRLMADCGLAVRETTAEKNQRARKV